jgi:GNAT acetyltransferase-like protein
MKSGATAAESGYLHREYAASLAEFGEPRFLPESRGWLLTRSIPRTDLRDAMGCYPLFCCADWTRLETDLGALCEVVTVTAVADPFAEAATEDLRRCFPDLFRPFKEHFIADLRHPTVSRHHRQKLRRAARWVTVERVPDPPSCAEEWERLYAHLRARRGLVGIRAFSASSFRRQLSIPDCVAFRALVDGRCVAMNLWYILRDIAYYHLGASEEEGYRVSASYPLIEAALATFTSEGLRWLNLGSSSGARFSADGLSRFKQGWASGTRTAHLCGRILDPNSYRRLAPRDPDAGEGYFPAYRAGEFA